MTRTISERLADHVVGLRYEDVPAAVIEKAKDLLIYHLGLAFSGHFTETGRHGVALAFDLSGGAGTSPIIGQRRRANPLDAVFANAQLINGGRWDDFMLPSGVHMSVITNPVAWVYGALHHRSGRELLTSVVVGYDVACALADPAGHVPGYTRRTQNPFAPFGAAAVAARLIGFDHARTAAAVAQAGHAGMGVVEGTEQDTSAIQGLLARNGVLAALVARVGRADTLRTIESPNGMYAAFYGSVPRGLEGSLAGLGHEFAILRASTKQYPGSGVYIGPVECTKRLMREHHLRAADVVRVQVAMSDEFHARSIYFESKFEEPNPSPANNAGSLRFSLAILLLDGSHRLERYSQPHTPELTDLIGRVAIRFESERAPGWARVEITTKDGRVLQVDTEDWVMPKGDWGAWLRADGTRIFSEPTLARLEQLLTNLEAVEDVAQVTDCLTEVG